MGAFALVLERGELEDLVQAMEILGPRPHVSITVESRSTPSHPIYSSYVFLLCHSHSTTVLFTPLLFTLFNNVYEPYIEESACFSSMNVFGMLSTLILRLLLLSLDFNLIVFFFHLFCSILFYLFFSFLCCYFSLFYFFFAHLCSCCQHL